MWITISDSDEAEEVKRNNDGGIVNDGSDSNDGDDDDISAVVSLSCACCRVGVIALCIMTYRSN